MESIDESNKLRLSIALLEYGGPFRTTIIYRLLQSLAVRGR